MFNYLRFTSYMPRCFIHILCKLVLRIYNQPKILLNDFTYKLFIVVCKAEIKQPIILHPGLIGTFIIDLELLVRKPSCVYVHIGSHLIFLT